MSTLLTGLESLILDEVPLLLVVVGDEHLRHEDFDPTCLGKFLVKFLLPSLGHLLLGSNIKSLLFLEVVAFAFLEQSFLLDARLSVKCANELTQILPFLLF